MTETDDEQHTFYDRVGGSPVFHALAEGFYRRVAADPVLRPMYPEEDLDPARRRLQLFLEQYWGGPSTYSEERGHPRLRMRHLPFKIDGEARERWLTCMTASVEELGLPATEKTELLDYLTRASLAMVNTLPRANTSP